ncbi:MAG: MmcQ/YjbR family DNA-binding protein [Acidimicrobiales bacterium]
MSTTRQHDRALAAVRSACLALPEVTERLSHGSPTFFVRGKKTFVMFVDDHHGDDILGIWCAAPPGVQGELIEAEPDRFFRPPYVGGRGWVGVRLDISLDADELVGVVTEAYRQVAPKTLVRQLDDGA